MPFCMGYAHLFAEEAELLDGSSGFVNTGGRLFFVGYAHLFAEKLSFSVPAPYFLRLCRRPL